MTNTNAKNTQADDNPSSAKTVEDFVRLTKPFAGEMLLYRGLADVDWLLEASACRRVKESGVMPPFNTFKKYILSLLEKAQMRGHQEQAGRTLSELELLAELQHHGAATCLIDFTYNPLVALWFACRKALDQNDEEQDGKVVVMNTDQAGVLDSTVGGKSELPGLFGIIGPKQFKRIKKTGIAEFLDDKTLWKWEPTPRSNRVIAQQSVFMFGKAEIESRNYEVVHVPASAKAGILRSLQEKFGVAEESLFGDFTGFALANAHDKPYEEYSADDYYNFARILHQQEEIEKTIYYCNKALAINPQHADTYQLRGECNMMPLEDFPSAIEDFNRSIEIDNQRAETYLYRGFAFEALSKPNAAIEDYTKVIEIASDKDDSRLRILLAWAHCRLGKLKAQQNEHDDAIKFFTSAIAIDPDFAQAYFGRSKSYHISGNAGLAAKDEKKAFELDPTLQKNTVVYELINGDSVVYIGTTNDPGRRESEHRATGRVFDTLKVKSAPMTAKDAITEEQKRLAEHKRIHGQLPQYNIDPNG